MKKSWMKRRSQKSGHSRRVFGRFTHVFRSCRKHSYDSEPGEEDAGGPQLQRTIRPPNNTPLGTPSGDSDTLLASSIHTTPSTLTGLSQTDELSDWSGSQQTVVERDARTARQGTTQGGVARHLGVEPLIPATSNDVPGSVWGSEVSLSGFSDLYSSAFSLYRGRSCAIRVFLPEGGLRRGSINGTIPDLARPHSNPKPPVLPPPSPRLGQRPAAVTIPGRGPSTPLTPRKKTVMPSQFQDTVSEEFEDKVKRPKSSAGSQVSGQDSRPVTPVSETSGRVSILRASPKLVRSGSKIFERLRMVEERRKSLDHTDSPFLVQSWLPLRKTRSFDQPGADGLAGSLASSSEELRDDLRDGVRSEIGGYTLRHPSLRHRTTSYDDRGAFAGGLRDIETRFSQELLRIKKTVSQQQLIRSSQDASRRSPSPQRNLPPQSAQKDPTAVQVSPSPKPIVEEDKKPTSLVTTRNPLVRSGATTKPVIEVTEPQRVISQRAPLVEKSSNGSAVHHDLLKPGETRFTSQPPKMTDKLLSPKPVTPQPILQREVISDLYSKRSPEPGREPPLTSNRAPPALEIAHRGISREKGTSLGETRFLPWAQPPVDNEKNHGKTGGQTKKHNETKSSKNSRSKGKSRRIRPTSPDLESSDDSYVSAGEDPLEAPVFDIPLQSALITAGSEVLLKCVISANPTPEVSWRKDRILLKNSPTHQIRMEGERYTLLLRWALPSDSGIYTVTARNEVGEASSCGAVTVRPAPSKESPAHRGTPRDPLSPITSDDEYLSPQEDLSEPSTPQHKMTAKAPPQHTVTFKAPPSFKVALLDKLVLEGQDVTLSVQVLGEPKPIINWLRNRQQVKASMRYRITERDGGHFCLHITGAEKRDSGYYTCKAINEYGTKQCESKLEVRGGVR
uniref:Ig-like domain-containing protein n=1 Tax=Leptobrachium leishanense TaxID=445787 RepID=A0A8C5QJP8_9ANUR